MQKKRSAGKVVSEKGYLGVDYKSGFSTFRLWKYQILLTLSDIYKIRYLFYWIKKGRETIDFKAFEPHCMIKIIFSWHLA